MPLPEDKAVVETASNLVRTLQGAFGTPAGYRPAHARGRMTRGSFHPSPYAAALSSAPQFNSPSTALLIRFSSSTGLPQIPDTDPNANPRGIGIRFLLSDDGHKHTDIIAHSSAYFPMRTGEGFLAMLGAIGGGTIGQFLEENPSAKAFVNDPKPSPVSFATEKFFGVTAFKFVSKDGKETFVRYRITPDAGHATLSDAELKDKEENYLFDDLPARLSEGYFSFKLSAQIASPGDPTDDATIHWPESREIVDLGKVVVDSVIEEAESKREQQRMIFDPIPRVEGVESSEDPLLDMRAAVYLVSGGGRRVAPSTA